MLDSIVDSKTVVAGVDRRPASELALTWAIRYAERYDFVLAVCHVVARPGNDDNGEDLLTVAARTARSQLPVERVQVILCHGSAAAELAALAAPAGLLVVGGRARLTWADRRIGSTSLEAAVSARSPVVVVRPEIATPGPVPGAVLVGVDGSAAGRAALRFGFDHAERAGLPVAAAHVGTTDAGPYWFDQKLLETHFATEPAVLRLLDTETEPYRRHYPSVPVKLVALGGAPVEALAAASNGADLLVIGNADGSPTHGRLGPVAYGLLSAAGCPVAVLRPPIAGVSGRSPLDADARVPDGVSSVWG